MQQSKVRLDFVCPKKWNTMTPEGNGRFCDACQKTVTDFSKIPLNQLNDAVRDLPVESNCGSFYAYQLNKPFGNRKDKIIAFYQRLILNKNKYKLSRPFILCLVITMLFITGCYRRTAGAIPVYHHKCPKEGQKEKF